MEFKQPKCRIWNLTDFNREFRRRIEAAVEKTGRIPVEEAMAIGYDIANENELHKLIYQFGMEKKVGFCTGRFEKRFVDKKPYLVKVEK
jgi:hypothetical protein